MIDGWARETDLAGLDALDFYSALHGYAYAALRGGAHDVEGIAAALAKMRCGSPGRVRAALRDLVQQHDVMTWGSLRSHVETVLTLSARRTLMRSAQAVAAAAERGDVTTIPGACRLLEEHAKDQRG
jgi:hypothetical protein